MFYLIKKVFNKKKKSLQKFKNTKNIKMIRAEMIKSSFM